MNATATHTPGDWETDCNVAVRSSGPDGRQICLCEITVRGRPYDETYDEAMANARLIAAAPDLLAALQKIVFNWDGEPEDMDEAREAIAKAVQS